MDLSFPAIKRRVSRSLWYAHVIYLGLLPAAATFWLLYKYGHPLPLLLFIGGTAAVGVYLAVVFYFSPIPLSVAWGLVVLLDGPLWVVLSIISKKGLPHDYIAESFVVEGTAIWLSILFLSLYDFRERLAAAGFMLLALIVTVSLVYPYYRDQLDREWLSLALLAMGITEALAVRYRQIKRDADHAATNRPKHRPKCGLHRRLHHSLVRCLDRRQRPPRNCRKIIGRVYMVMERFRPV